MDTFLSLQKFKVPTILKQHLFEDMESIHPSSPDPSTLDTN